VKSFVALTTVPIGFDPANAWSLRVTLSGPSYSTPAAIRAYVDSAVERLHAVAGVRDAAAATSSPPHAPVDQAPQPIRVTARRRLQEPVV